MRVICVKIRSRSAGCKYRKMLSTNELVFPELETLVYNAEPYSPGTALEEDEWFAINELSTEPYAIDIVKNNYSTIDFETLDKMDFKSIDFLFVIDGDNIFFQKVSKTKLATKKTIWNFGEQYRFDNDVNEIVIKDIPDAIYNKKTDTLYFKKLEIITGIFRGIEMLYREATNKEVYDFLHNDFITLENDFSVENVKTANRKRIAMATDALKKLDEKDRKNIFIYIAEYCPDLKREDSAFSVGNEEELKFLTWGIEQRFYTTPVGNERRIASAVITMEK